MSRLSLLLGLSAVALAACNPDDPKGRPAPRDAHLERFASCAELKEHIVDATTEMLVSALYDGYYGVDVAMEEGATDDAAGGDKGGESAPTDYSSTNVQEAGVDEADIVKTDGEYLYIAQMDELTIVDAWPASEAAVVAHLPLGGSATGLYLYNDRAVVFSQVYDSGEGPFAYGTSRVSIVDLTDRANPQILREIDLSGAMASSRLIGSDLYLVQSSYGALPEELWSTLEGLEGDLPDPEALWDASEAEREAAKETARDLIRPRVSLALADTDATELILQMKDHAPGEEVDATSPLACTDLYRTENLSYPSTLATLHLDLSSDGGDLAGEGVLGEGWTVYANEDSLTIAQASWSWWWDGEGVETQLHHFDLSAGAPVYVASGAVDGWILGQYSMSMHNGYLRVASTDPGDSDSGGGDVAVSSESDEAPAEEPKQTGESARTVATPKSEPGNLVTVLGVEGDDLVEVGSVRGIAPDETIYAVRMMGDKGYVVTFQQTDPLFTLDLSDPTNPTVVGELHIPGYSAYLHPIDDTHILGIGMDGTDDGTITGFAVSLFDISDFANPVLQQKFSLATTSDWSYSEALWDPHAFTLHNGVMAVPVYSDSYDDSTGVYSHFSGVQVMAVDSSGMSDLGQVDHADLVGLSDCLYSGEYDYGEDEAVSSGGDVGAPEDTDTAEEPDSGDLCAESYWYATVRRSVFIEGNLYSISDYGVKITEATDPTALQGTVLFWPAAAE